MTRLDPADQLAALMRSQIAGLRSRTAKSPSRAGAALRSGVNSDKPDAAAMAASRIRGIAPDDPDRERKALRAFLECVFLSEFGPHIAQDAGFSRMVDHVQDQMQADPQLAEAAAQAARALLKS